MWYRRMVTHLLQSMTKAGVVKGHISTGVQAKVTRIKDENVQTQMIDDPTVKSAHGTNKIIQFALMRVSAAESFAVEVGVSFKLRSRGH